MTPEEFYELLKQHQIELTDRQKQQFDAILNCSLNGMKIST